MVLITDPVFRRMYEETLMCGRYKSVFYNSETGDEFCVHFPKNRYVTVKRSQGPPPAQPRVTVKFLAEQGPEPKIDGTYYVWGARGTHNNPSQRFSVLYDDGFYNYHIDPENSEASDNLATLLLVCLALW